VQILQAVGSVEEMERLLSYCHLSLEPVNGSHEIRCSESWFSFLKILMLNMHSVI
jgi:hypothetical protein